MQIAAVFLCSL